MHSKSANKVIDICLVVLNGYPWTEFVKDTTPALSFCSRFDSFGKFSEMSIMSRLVFEAWAEDDKIGEKIRQCKIQIVKKFVPGKIECT